MKRTVGLAAALALVALAGCGGDARDEPEPTPQPAQVADPRGEPAAPAGGTTVEADPGGAPVFRPEELRAEAGRVALELVNLSATPHALCVESAEQGGLGCTGTFSGDRSTLKLRLEAGRYTFFCSVAGHRDAGMEGTLVIG
jgi:plastocyanin